MIDQQFLRLKDVIKRVGLSRSTIYRKMKNLEFPLPIPIGYRAVAWVEEDITEWINHKIAKARSDKQ